MKRIHWIALVLVLVALLPGCGLFGGRKTDYQLSKEARPLDVPPDLDTPATGTSLTIPDTGGATTAAPSGTSAGTVSPPPSSPIIAGSASTLKVSDGVAGAWRRIGLALERSQVAEIVSRDESAGTYTLTASSTVRSEDQGGFLKRMFTRDKTETATVTRVVRVVAEGTGSMVRVEDEAGAPADDELARRVIEALRQRLG